MFKALHENFIHWLTYEETRKGFPLCDFERLCYEVRGCDVLLIEGRSRVSEIIKLVTQSSWSHACLYLGRLHDIDDMEMRNLVIQHFNPEPEQQLILESILGKGTIVSPLEIYRNEHIRICRPRGLFRRDAQDILSSAIKQLGSDYDTRQIFDLIRFMYPWSLLPRRWRSSLFEHRAGKNTKTVCSTLLADAFGSINFPILPLIKRNEETGIELIQRNPKFFTPCDFDYSPYFDIIKYPFLDVSEYGTYRNLPWNREGLLSNDSAGVFTPHIDGSTKKIIRIEKSVYINKAREIIKVQKKNKA